MCAQPFRVAAAPCRSPQRPPAADSVHRLERNLLVTWSLSAERPPRTPCHDCAPPVSYPGGSDLNGHSQLHVSVSEPQRIVTDQHRQRPYGNSTFGQLDHAWKWT